MTRNTQMKRVERYPKHLKFFFVDQPNSMKQLDLCESLWVNRMQAQININKTLLPRFTWTSYYVCKIFIYCQSLIIQSSFFSSSSVFLLCISVFHAIYRIIIINHCTNFCKSHFCHFVLIRGKTLVLRFVFEFAFDWLFSFKWTHPLSLFCILILKMP